MDNIYILSVKGLDVALGAFNCTSKYFYESKNEAQSDVNNFIEKCSDKKYLLCLNTSEKYSITITELFRKD